MLDQIEKLIHDINSLQKDFYNILDNNEIKPSINYARMEVRHIMDDKTDVSKRFFHIFQNIWNSLIFLAYSPLLF